MAKPQRSHGRAARRILTLAAGIGLACASTSARADDPSTATVDGFHRGVGWYDADVKIPEPPLALALVIVGAWAMRRRERRLGRR
ncbi:MAG: hypothetical protein R3B09_20320 [Nannocystaceae bacterium]